MEKLRELETFLADLKKYQHFIALREEGKLSSSKITYTEGLRENVVIESGKLSLYITKLIGTDTITIHEFGQPRSVNAWSMGLRSEFDYRTSEALNACIDFTLRAIGILRGEGKKKVEPAEALEDNEESQGKHASEEVRKHLQGTPGEIAPHVVRVAQNFQFQGFNYHAKEEVYEQSQFSKQLTIYRITDSFTPGVIWMHASPEDEPRVIGFITLQSLPNNKTLLIAKNNLPSFDDGGSYFDSFLERLSSEFKSLGIEETKAQKIWRWFKEIIGIVKVIKP